MKQQPIEWKFHHYLKDGREITDGVQIELTPDNVDTIERTMNLMEKHMARLQITVTG